MQPSARQISTCPTCGERLEETPGGGLGCMSCLLRAGIGSEEEVTQDSTPNAFEAGGASVFMKSIVTRMEVSASLAVERWASRIAPPTRRSSEKSP